MTQLNWGILGTGNIARQFAAGARTARCSPIAAVASRNPEKAQAFAAAQSIATAYGRYDDLIRDPAIAAVYISLPNSMHHPWAIKALRAGKHVLCEKPLAASAAEAQEMFDESRRAGRILVEAFMYRAHPLTAAVVQAARGGDIGPIRLIRSSFCYRTTRIADNIRFDPALSGGALMDIGCYCIDFSTLIAGQPPSAVHASGHLHDRGVDDVSAGTLSFPNGIVASFTCGMSVQVDNSAYICGEDGYIEVPVPWKPPLQNATYIVTRGTPPKMDGPKSSGPPPRQVCSVDANMDLYGLEADAFAATVLDGRPPFITEQDSLSNMRTLDSMRQQLAMRI